MRTEHLEDNQELIVRLLKGIRNGREVAGELQEKIKVTNYRTKAVVVRKALKSVS